EDVQKVSWIDAVNEFQVKVSGVLRAYMPDEDTWMNTIYLSDTITPQLTAVEEWWAGEYVLPDPEQMLREVAAYVATEAHVHFVPYWSNDTRWYYVSSDSRWKEAAAFAAAEHWEKAAAIWESLYEKSASRKAKARLASNLALTAELAGQLTQALQWATLAHQYLSDLLGNENKEVKMQKLYVDVLGHRISAEKTLRTQMEE
ncbi:MAG: DUF6340 family protein, partial [Tannerella sp.]|nr:DUF6340 family protein [Tannerella sp.]